MFPLTIVEYINYHWIHLFAKHSHTFLSLDYSIGINRDMSSRIDRGYSSTTDRHSRPSSHYVREQPNAGMSNSPWEFENPWSHGLCNITDQCGETCYAIWCFPCFSCHLAWRMNESCWIVCCLPSYLAVLRTKMRTTFRINVILNEIHLFLLDIDVFFFFVLLLGFVLFWFLCWWMLSTLYCIANGQWITFSTNHELEFHSHFD